MIYIKIELQNLYFYYFILKIGYFFSLFLIIQIYYFDVNILYASIHNIQKIQNEIHKNNICVLTIFFSFIQYIIFLIKYINKITNGNNTINKLNLLLLQRNRGIKKLETFETIKKYIAVLRASLSDSFISFLIFPQSVHLR